MKSNLFLFIFLISFDQIFLKVSPSLDSYDTADTESDSKLSVLIEYSNNDDDAPTPAVGDENSLNLNNEDTLAIDNVLVIGTDSNLSEGTNLDDGYNIQDFFIYFRNRLRVGKTYDYSDDTNNNNNDVYQINNFNTEATTSAAAVEWWTETTQSVDVDNIPSDEDNDEEDNDSFEIDNDDEQIVTSSYESVVQQYNNNNVEDVDDKVRSNLKYYMYKFGDIDNVDLSNQNNNLNVEKKDYLLADEIDLDVNESDDRNSLYLYKNYAKSTFRKYKISFILGGVFLAFLILTISLMMIVKIKKRNRRLARIKNYDTLQNESEDELLLV